MRVGDVQDERQADDLRPEQRERGHAVPGLPEVLDRGPLAVGVGTDEPVVHLEVLRRRREIALGERGVVRAQEDFGLDGGIAGIAGIAGMADRPHRSAVAPQRAADEIDLVERPARSPVGHALVITRAAVALAHQVPAVRRTGGELELDEVRGIELRVPESAAGEVDPLRRDDPRRVAETALVLLLLRAESEIELSGVGEMQLPAALRQVHPIAAQSRGRWREVSGGNRVVAKEGCDFAQRHRLDRWHRGGDLELPVEQELDRAAAQQQHPVVDRQPPALGVELDGEPVRDGDSGALLAARRAHRRRHQQTGERQPPGAAARVHCAPPDGGAAGAGGAGAPGGTGAAGGAGGTGAAGGGGGIGGVSGVRRK